MEWSLIIQEWRALPGVFWQLINSPVTLAALAAGGLLGMVVGMLPFPMLKK